MDHKAVWTGLVDLIGRTLGRGGDAGATSANVAECGAAMNLRLNIAE